MRNVVCDVCGGDGRSPRDPCETCRGDGMVVEQRRVEVEIPAGIADGQRIRVTGRGHAGERGGPNGDLYVVVRVREDERFLRDGSDLVTVVDVAAPLAALGTTVEVPTLDGPIPVEIKAGHAAGRGDPARRPRHAAAAARAHRRPARGGQRHDPAPAHAPSSATCSSASPAPSPTTTSATTRA